MTMTKIFSIYDRKAQYYLPLMQHRTEADAIREFQGLVVNSETPISLYPADFDLICLGDFDPELGSLGRTPHPQPVINGLVALQQAQAERNRYRAILESREPETSPEA